MILLSEARGLSLYILLGARARLSAFSFSLNKGHRVQGVVLLVCSSYLYLVMPSLSRFGSFYYYRCYPLV